MKVNKKFRRIIKKVLKPYNLAIFGCIILISVSMFVIFKPDKNNTSTENSKTSNTKTEVIKSDEKDITEEKARKLAKKQFKKLGENIKESELQVEKIQRKGEDYFYITSEKNTLEIKIDSGKITRINSVAVE